MDNFEYIKLMDREELADFLARSHKEVIDFFERDGKIKTDFNLDNQTELNKNWLAKEIGE